MSFTVKASLTPNMGPHLAQTCRISQISLLHSQQGSESRNGTLCVLQQGDGLKSPCEKLLMIGVPRRQFSTKTKRPILWRLTLIIMRNSRQNSYHCFEGWVLKKSWLPNTKKHCITSIRVTKMKSKNMHMQHVLMCCCSNDIKLCFSQIFQIVSTVGLRCFTGLS